MEGKGDEFRKARAREHVSERRGGGGKRERNPVDPSRCHVATPKSTLERVA